MNYHSQDLSWSFGFHISKAKRRFLKIEVNPTLINLLSGWIDASADHFLNFLFPKEESLYKRPIRILRAKLIFRFRSWDIFSRNRSHSGILKRVLLPSYRYWEYWRKDQASMDGVRSSFPSPTCPQSRAVVRTNPRGERSISSAMDLDGIIVVRCPNPSIRCTIWTKIFACRQHGRVDG